MNLLMPIYQIWFWNQAKYLITIWMVHCSVLCFIRRKRNCYNSMSVRLRHIPTWSCGRTFSKHIVLKRSYTFGVFCYLHRQKWWRSLKLQSDKNLENEMSSSWLYLNFPIYILVLQLRFVPLLYHYVKQVSSFQDSSEDENVNYIGLEFTIVRLPSESSSPAFGRSSVDATTT